MCGGQTLGGGGVLLNSSFRSNKIGLASPVRAGLLSFKRYVVLYMKLLHGSFFFPALRPPMFLVDRWIEIETEGQH